MSSNIRTNLQRALGCNYKALALFRITIGALLLCELLLRFRYLEPFYSDEGTLPLYLLLPKIDTLYKAVCIHSWGGSVLFQGALLGSQVFLALGVTIGYQTQIYAFLSWYLYLSLTLRNTWLAFILDRYFHYMLFFLAFLPSGEVWSVDALRKELRSKQARQEEGPVQNATICNLATVAIKMQILWIYLDAGIGKYMDPLQGWTFHASISALDTYTRHTVGARYVYALLGPFGLKLLTPVVVWIEILCVPICLAGLYKGYNRIVMFNVCVIVSLHLGISVTLRNTVLLSLVACSAWCVYIPPNVFGNDDNPSKIVSSRLSLGSKSMIIALFFGCLWFELFSNDCTQSVKHIYSNLLHNRWNGAEEYVTWEIAPGRLHDGSIVDIWSNKDDVDWNMPVSGAACTSTARHGRWRSFPYLAGLDGEDGDALWGYLCKQWNKDHPPEKHLLRFNFFMLQADVLPNMGFSATRKRLIHSRECESTEDDIEEIVEIYSEIAIEEL